MNAGAILLAAISGLAMTLIMVPIALLSQYLNRKANQRRKRRDEERVLRAVRDLPPEY
jgi:hypothetical protein